MENKKRLDDIITTKIELEELRKTANQEENEAIEITLLALRDAERVEINRLQDNIPSDMKKEGENLQKLAAEIRKKVKKLNKTNKILDSIEKGIHILVDIINGIIRWK